MIYATKLKMNQVELATSWKLILADLQQFEPLLTAYIEGSLFEKKTQGDGHPFFQVLFPKVLHNQFSYWENNPEAAQKLKNYFYCICQEEVDIRFELDREGTLISPEKLKPIENPLQMNSHDNDFVTDKVSDPILGKMEEIFKLSLIQSRKAPKI